ncbi:hypothetical protein ACQPXB_27705 [Amycolatopsis sp. CA-161197]|uniref:hypothetical protein n=1 Tax=Amycolatopsis sp. CA-161197 TaxID=3239922 RepID=UPI003D92A3FE
MEEAVQLDLDAVVLTDHNGMSGAVCFAEAGRDLGIRTGHGAEWPAGHRRARVVHIRRGVSLCGCQAATGTGAGWGWR